MLLSAPAPASCRSRSRRLVRCSAGADNAVAAALSLLLAQPGVSAPDMYASTSATAAAVATLSAGSPVPAASTRASGDGDWRVFHAPHLRSVDALGLRFQPRYVVSDTGRRIRSDVHWAWAGLGGWVSAAGTLETEGSDSLVLFSDFWTSGEGAEPGPLPPPPLAGFAAFVQSAGQAGFLPSLSRFPVRFFDADAGVTVFEFPPLRTVIATKRV